MESETVKTPRDGEDALVTPREIAEAIGASESSLRRWIDAGDIRISRTAGGHRRILLADAVQFIRKIGATVIRPQALGLADLASVDTRAAAGADRDSALFEALTVPHAGDSGPSARALILAWYLAGDSAASIFDGPVRSAMHRVGDLWKHDERGILVEHRATDTCIAALVSLRTLLPAAPANEDRAPLALGGAPQGDPYQIPSMMAAIVLAEAAFREINFGANTPLELLADEARATNARLVWVSISAAQDPKALRPAIGKLSSALAGVASSSASRRTHLVVGGAGAAACVPRGGAQGLVLVNSMTELAAFARGVCEASEGQ